MGWLVFAFLIWITGWSLNVVLSKREPTRILSLLIPVIFGVTLILIWEGIVRGFEISPILLPPPSMIATRFAASTSILWQDFVQTVIKGALSGYIIGCGCFFDRYCD